MKTFLTFAIVSLWSVSATYHRPINIIAYQYIPDLQGDSYAHLTEFLQDRFQSDTGRRINVLYDLSGDTDTYTPSNVVAALTSGGYDMQEIDTIILGAILDYNVLSPIPASYSYVGYSPQVLRMVSDSSGTFWGAPTYTCANVFFSYDDSITRTHNFAEFNLWMQSHTKPGQIGWAADLSDGLDLRLQYLDGWKDSFQTIPFQPIGYSPNPAYIDPTVVENIIIERNSCDNTTVRPHNNPCTDGTYYNYPNVWFQQFVDGDSLVLQGFPEYTSNLLALTNTDPNNPTRLHTAWSALNGNGNRPYIFTDAWVVSKQNCDADCQTTSLIFLNWSRLNWAQLISLGADLTPNRPRFLSVAYDPFYDSETMNSLPLFAQDYYQFFHFEIARGVNLDTLYFWQNENSQANVLTNLILNGYHP